MAPNFIWAANDNVMIHFPKKRCLSVLTTCTIRMRHRGVKKFGSSKDFDVCGILEKEPGSNEPSSYQAD
jgi:hypothetical protein